MSADARLPNFHAMERFSPAIIADKPCGARPVIWTETSRFGGRVAGDLDGNEVIRHGWGLGARFARKFFFGRDESYSAELFPDEAGAEGEVFLLDQIAQGRHAFFNGRHGDWIEPVKVPTRCSGSRERKERCADR